MIRLRHLRLTPKLTLAFVLFAVALLGFIGVLAYYSGRGGLEAATLSALASIATDKQSMLSNWVDERQSDLAVFATSPKNREILAAFVGSRRGSAEAQSAHGHLVGELQANTGEKSVLSALWIMDPGTGQVIASTDPETEGTFKEDRPYFVNGKNGPYVQNPYYSLPLQQVTMTVSVPFRSADGQLLAVVAANVNLDGMNAIITGRTGLQQTDDAFLVNTSNLFVTQPRLLSDPAVLQRGVHTEAVDLCLTGNSGDIAALDYRGVPAIVVYRWLPERQMCLIVKIDQTEAFAPVQTFGVTLALTGGLALLIGSLLAIGLARTLTRPILALQSGVMRIGQGELDFRFPESSADELGLLTRAFNEMTAALGEKDSQLRGYATQLEQRVDERTTALRASQTMFEGLFEAAPDAIVVIDGEGYISRLNAAAEGLFGYRREELYGKPIEALMPERFSDLHVGQRKRYSLQPYTRAMAVGLDIYGRRKDESEFPAEITLGPLQAEEGTMVLSIIRDITERKRMEQSTAELAAIVMFSEDAIIGKNLNGIITSWNTGAEKIYGYSESEVIGKPISILIPADHQNEVPEILNKVQGGKSVDAYETVRQRKNGQLIHVSISVSPIRNTGGRIVAASTIARDITQRKQAEEALKKSEALLATMGSLAHVGGWELNLETSELVWTKEVRRIYEVDPSYNPNVAEAIEFYAPASRPIIERAVQRTIDLGEPYDLELEFITAKGNRKWVHTIGNAHQENGKTKTISGMFQDITERKRAEQAQRRYAERLQAINHLDRIIASNLDIDLVYDSFVKELLALIPLDRTSIVLMNEAGDEWQLVRQWTSHQPAILPGGWRPVPGSVFEWIITNRTPYLENEIGERGTWPETEILKREGLHSRLLLPFIVQERVVGLLTVASHQSAAFSKEDQELLATIVDQLAIAIQNSNLYAQVQRHAAELEQRVLQRTAQLEASNKELEAFSYSVSHDLRAPLRGIDGYARILLRDYAPLVPEDGLRRLQSMRDMTQHMGKLIDNLLALSRLNRQSLVKQSVDINKLVKEVLEDLKDDMGQRQIELVLGELPDCQADRNLLKQVLTNLLSNALKYSRPREVSRIEVGTLKNDDRLVYFVRDNGVGFDMQYANKLFGVFQRLHSTEEFEGTGVGLAIVQRIINRHGGSVWAEAAPDAGASFFFTLEGVSTNDGR